MSDLQQFVDEVNQRPPSGIDPIPEIKQVIGFDHLVDQGHVQDVGHEAVADALDLVQPRLVTQQS